MNELETRVSLLRSRIAEANSGLAAAEQDMERAISQLAPVLVGDKRMSSEALDSAFRKLKDARQLITDLEKMLVKALSPPPEPSR